MASVAINSAINAGSKHLDPATQRMYFISLTTQRADGVGSRPRASSSAQASTASPESLSSEVSRLEAERSDGGGARSAVVRPLGLRQLGERGAARGGRRRRRRGVGGARGGASCARAPRREPRRAAAPIKQAARHRAAVARDAAAAPAVAPPGCSGRAARRRSSRRAAAAARMGRAFARQEQVEPPWDISGGAVDAAEAPRHRAARCRRCWACRKAAARRSASPSRASCESGVGASAVCAYIRTL